ncbi:MAG TPA: hypothetical protein VKB36_07865, partial [Vicinamibacterales bacterium]|nr:hypothetical protein [Vicinamibacterales bacterium]
ISPAATGVVYMAATARLSYALGEEREMPRALTRTNANDVPVVSILVAAVVGTLALGPFKSWNALVAVVTGAVAIMYAFAPVSLAALHKVDGTRPRSYRVPVPKLLLPAAFCSANLIMYWGGFDTTWKLTLAMAAGFALFAIGAIRRNTGALRATGSALWMVPWLGGHVIIGVLGRYGGGRNVLPDWIDLLVVVVFSLVIFYWAVGLSLSKEQAAIAVAKDAHQM